MKKELTVAQVAKDSREMAWDAVKVARRGCTRIINIARGYGKDREKAYVKSGSLIVGMSVPDFYGNEWDISTLSIMAPELDELLADPEFVEMVTTKLRTIRLRKFREANREYIIAARALKKVTEIEFPHH